jgi:serine phosphatase RsbU (regulator of sigma subunit)
MFAGHVETDASHLVAALPEIKGAFRIGVLHQHSPSAMLRSLNWLLSGGETECMLSAAIAVINPKNGAIEIAAAGDIGAVAFTSKGIGSKLMSTRSPPAGNGKAVEYKPKKVKTEPGTTIALYTPGTTSATDEYGATLGEKTFLKALRDAAAKPAMTQIDEVLTDLGSFLQSESTENDVTLILGHRPL